VPAHRDAAGRPRSSRGLGRGQDDRRIKVALRLTQDRDGGAPIVVESRTNTVLVPAAFDAARPFRLEIDPTPADYVLDDAVIVLVMPADARERVNVVNRKRGTLFAASCASSTSTRRRIPNQGSQRSGSRRTRTPASMTVAMQPASRSFAMASVTSRIVAVVRGWASPWILM
jgi:hypothetical protein